jgi:hypothetical protein
MNGISKSLFTLTGITVTSLAVIGILTLAPISPQSRDMFCGNANLDNTLIDHDLPLSHPANRCATEQSQGVSWASWFTGRSSSYQFHFIDLLELLSRSSDSGQNHPSKVE